MRYLFLILGLLTVFLGYLRPGEWTMWCALVLMILAHEFTHWLAARYFGFSTPLFSIGFGTSPRLKLGKLWETEFVMTPWLIGGYVDVDPSAEEAQTKPAWQRLLVIASGTVSNVLIAFAIMFTLFVAVGYKHVESDGIAVARVVAKAPGAAEAGFKPGDKIISVDGVPVSSYNELHSKLSVHADGSPAVVTVVRGKAKLDLVVFPDSRGLIGVTLQALTTTTYEQVGVFDAFARAWHDVFEMGTKFILGVLMIAHIIPVPPGITDGTGDAHGLLSMLQLGGIAFQQGAYNFASLVAFFSINLAFLNMIPVPMFDGGHLVFFAWEKLTGKAVSKEWRSRLSKICLWIVLAVMAYALLNDIFHPVA